MQIKASFVLRFCGTNTEELLGFHIGFNGASIASASRTIPQIPACVGSVPLHCLTHTLKRIGVCYTFDHFASSSPARMFHPHFPTEPSIMSSWSSAASPAVCSLLHQVQPEPLEAEMKVEEHSFISEVSSVTFHWVLKYVTNPVDWP